MKKQVIQIVSSLAAMVSVVGLSACTTQKAQPTTAHVQVTQQNMYESRGYSIGMLEANGVQVIHVGQIIQIIVPSDRLFTQSSANLEPSSKAMLHSISNYIKTYKTDKIKVSAYTDATIGNGVSQDKAGIALTSGQAQAVSSYFWSQGIDTRYIYAKGYGGADSVASNDSPKGQYDNRRVVISFQYK